MRTKGPAQVRMAAGETHEAEAAKTSGEQAAASMVLAFLKGRNWAWLHTAPPTRAGFLGSTPNER